jgi:hypothetical protein
MIFPMSPSWIIRITGTSLNFSSWEPLTSVHDIRTLSWGRIQLQAHWVLLAGFSSLWAIGARASVSPEWLATDHPPFLATWAFPPWKLASSKRATKKAIEGVWQQDRHQKMFNLDIPRIGLISPLCCWLFKERGWLQIYGNQEADIWDAILEAVHHKKYAHIYLCKNRIVLFHNLFQFTKTKKSPICHH